MSARADAAVEISVETAARLRYESNLMAFKKSLLAAHGARDRRGALASVLGVDPVREPQIQDLAVAALAEADAVLAMIEDGALDKPVMFPRPRRNLL